MSAYVKVNSLNIKGSKNTYLVYYYVHRVEMLFCITISRGRARLFTISPSVCGPHEIAPRAAGCRPLLYAMRDNWLNMLYICGNALCDEGQLAKYAVYMW